MDDVEANGSEGGAQDRSGKGQARSEPGYPTLGTMYLMISKLRKGGIHSVFCDGEETRSE